MIDTNLGSHDESVLEKKISVMKTGLVVENQLFEIQIERSVLWKCWEKQGVYYMLFQTQYST